MFQSQRSVGLIRVENERGEAIALPSGRTYPCPTLKKNYVLKLW
jgi:hypothetical protein